MFCCVHTTEPLLSYDDFYDGAVCVDKAAQLGLFFFFNYSADLFVALIQGLTMKRGKVGDLSEVFLFK